MLWEIPSGFVIVLGEGASLRREETPGEHHPGGHLLSSERWWPRKSSSHLHRGLEALEAPCLGTCRSAHKNARHFRCLFFKKEKIKFSKSFCRQRLYMER